MTDFDNSRLETSVEQGIARRRNRRNLYVLSAAATVGAVVVAAALLVPSGPVISAQLGSEVAKGNPSVAVLPPEPAGRPELLEGTHGGTFIVGSKVGLIGTTMSAQNVVNSHDASAFRNGTFLFRNERVQTSPAISVFSIGKSPADALLVHIGPNTQRPLPNVVHEVGPGQNIAVSGTIKPMPTMYTVNHTWGVSAHELGRLGNSSIYIEANAVQLLTK